MIKTQTNLDLLHEDLLNIIKYTPKSLIQPTIDELLVAETSGLDLPYPGLNSFIKGLKLGRLITLLAGSKIGKSTFTKEIVKYLVDNNDIKIGVAYLEETQKTSGLSFIALDNNIPLYELEEHPHIIEKEKFQESYNKYIGSKIISLNASFMKLTGDELIYNLRWLIEGLGCKIIVLDHITMVTYDMKGENSERKDIDILVKNLRALINETGCTIIMVSHLKRPQFGKSYDEGREVHMSDGRGCVDCDTEYLTPKGWKHIADYKEGDLVGTYLDTEDGAGELRFEKPTRFIKQNNKKFYHLKTIRGIDQVVSPEHKIIYQHGTKDRHIYLNKCTAEHFVEIHNKSKNGNRRKIRTTYNAKICSKLEISKKELDLRLAIAYQADGTLSKRPLCHVFKFLKERKYKRLLRLVKAAGVEYKDYGKFPCGQYCVETKLRIAEKDFSKVCSFDITEQEALIFTDESQYWDGDAKSYRSTNKYNAEFIQHCFSLSGIRSIITVSKRGRYSSNGCLYSVRKSNNNTVSMYNKDKKIEINEYKAKDGKQYCFTTSTGMWVARRNSRIFITGNSAALEQVSDIIIGLERDIYSGSSLTKVKVCGNRITGKTGYTDDLIYVETTGRLEVLK